MLSRDEHEKSCITSKSGKARTSLLYYRDYRNFTKASLLYILLFLKTNNEKKRMNAFTDLRTECLHATIRFSLCHKAHYVSDAVACVCKCMSISVKPGTHDETFVCNSVLQTKVSWCVRPRNMFQEILMFLEQFHRIGHCFIS